jgi:hypothetical protein
MMPPDGSDSGGSSSGSGDSSGGGSNGDSSDSGDSPALQPAVSPEPVPLHQRLRESAASLTQDRVSVAQLADSHGAAAQGTLMVLLAAPCMLPMPGVGTVLGLGLAMMALAIWRGQTDTALPPRVAGFQMSGRSASRVLGLLAHFHELAGKFARRRLHGLSGTGLQGWLAALTGVMAVLIILPIPFGNVLPATALMLLGLGLVYRDGVAVLLAIGTAAAALLYTATLGLAAWSWGMAPLLQQWRSLQP